MTQYYILIKDESEIQRELKNCRVGDSVCFKCDVEQCGTIIAITGTRVMLENENGFDGDYIGGNSRTTVDASECWVE